MFRYTRGLQFITKVMKVARPPVTGYEVAELPNEKLLGEFMQHYKAKGIIVILHNADGYLLSAPQSNAGNKKGNAAPPTKGNGRVEGDPLTRSFLSSINGLNLGHPDEVKLALVPGSMCPRVVEAYNVLTYPTSLLFIDGACVYRVTGARTNELSIKSLFMLRNASRNIFSRT